MNPTPRRHFLRQLCAGAGCVPVLSLLGADYDKLRGDRVGWARLKTPSEWWMRRAGGDPKLMRFLSEQTHAEH